MSERPVIAIIGVGQMGAAVGARCVVRGAHVLTPLAGRSDASRQRACAGGMTPCAFDDLVQADIILSILPPGVAMDVAQSVAPLLGRRATLFVDANALAPETKRAMEIKVTAAGGRFVDGAIVGGPPRGDEAGPRFYLSGQHASAAVFLGDMDLDIRDLKAPVGAASALKMCYGGLNKGLTALITALLLAAESSDIAEALMDELAQSQRFMHDHAHRSVPAMYPKAYRWVAEFEEIAEFVGMQTPAGAVFEDIAHFFRERAFAGTMEAELSRIKTILGHDPHEGN